jgi:putative FmdB family regulatory protein
MSEVGYFSTGLFSIGLFTFGGIQTLPLYAYRCTQCGHRFEKIQHFSSEPELVCPVCQGVLERPLTAPRLHFKGAGWYVNDYAAKSSAPAAESASSETKATEAKAENAPSASPAPAAAATSTTESSAATTSQS